MSHTGQTPTDQSTAAQGFELPPPPSDLGGCLQQLLEARVPRQLGAGPAPGCLRELLHQPDPVPEHLELAKQFAKENRKDPAGRLPPEVATVLYYATIAVALARCGRRMSRHDDATLRQGFRWGCAQSWVDEATRELLRAGLRHLGDDGAE